MDRLDRVKANSRRVCASSAGAYAVCVAGYRVLQR